jgi:uncharacterized membrane protein YkoI
MLPRVTAVSTCSLLAGVIFACRAVAAEPVVPPPPPLAIGPDHAAEIAREQTGGRILDVRPASGSSAYEVRVLLNEGRIRRVVVDVNSGRME